MATTSSSIASKLKSPTSSTSPSTNGYLNSPISPPPRVPPPPPTQESEPMDITLTLSPITPLDIQFNTSSPPPPLFGHPIPWNLLEAHEASCLLKRTLELGTRGVEYGEEELRYRTTINPCVVSGNENDVTKGNGIKENEKTWDGFRRVRNGTKTTTRMGNREGQREPQEQWDAKWMNECPDEKDVFDEVT
ncbi:hypothetical protein Tco_1360854 [Tanacetum coccineum]